MFLIESTINGSMKNCREDLFFLSFWRSPKAITVDTSGWSLKLCERLFHAFNFSIVKSVESFTEITIRLPSSPNLSVNFLYLIFSGCVSGSKLASV